MPANWQISNILSSQNVLAYYKMRCCITYHDNSLTTHRLHDMNVLIIFLAFYETLFPSYFLPKLINWDWQYHHDLDIMILYKFLELFHLTFGLCYTLQFSNRYHSSIPKDQRKNFSQRGLNHRQIKIFDGRSTLSSDILEFIFKGRLIMEWVYYGCNIHTCIHTHVLQI